ncbi:MAG: NTP transferase domain-containing protein [Planctomycetaceae bacterium]|jgi:spore coat polysaccharide biosynthesis protein SpsF (cytidylyltransferase family)|nr:NTP transferase domain-containing protein [Planctomycetaceae bacterium]
MLKTLGIVKGAHLTERQIQHLNRRLGGRSFLDWVVRQLKSCYQISDVVVTTDRSIGGETIRRLIPGDVESYVSNGEDSLACVVDTLKKFQAESCVFIGADWPFLDPIVVDELVRAATQDPNCDYAAYQFVNETFGNDRNYGLFPEYYRTKTLLDINPATKDPLYRSLLGTLFLENQRKYKIELLPAPWWLDYGKIRTIVSGEAGWEVLVTIYETLKDSERCCNIEQVSKLLQNHPGLLDRVAFEKQATMVVAVG